LTGCSAIPYTAAVPASGRWEPRWLLLLVLVYGALAIVVVRPVIDPDVWWHLRAGQWIVEHRAVPWTDPFSTYGLGKPWIAYNWLFEVGLYGLYRALGLFGLLVFVVVVALAITVALRALIMRFEPRITRSATLTALGVGAMGPVLMPRSYLFSILFFLIVLHILFSVRESKRVRPLLWLPPLFVLWANVHIQFIYGLLALALAVIESLIPRVVTRETRGPASRSAPLRPLVLVTLASCAATLITPYHVYLHDSILDVARQAGMFDWIIELMAMDFRQGANWLVLGLAVGAAFLLGRQRAIEPFPALLFLAGVAPAFRSRRDVWLVTIPALVVIAASLSERAPHEGRLTWRRLGLVGAGAALAFVAVGVARDVSPRGLQAAVAREYPVAAADVVEARGYPGPLFNPYDWGGYLIWRLPQLPVVMDGRANVHGDARIVQSIATWYGQGAWVSNRDLTVARVVIAPINLGLTSLLRVDPRFELAYEDDVAAVFVARGGRAAR
jgi:hypothetical protein